MVATTRTLISRINDAGEFERLAMAVLRLESQYHGLNHHGVNAAGFTVKAPVEGAAAMPTSLSLFVTHTVAGVARNPGAWIGPRRDRRRPCGNRESNN